MQFICYFVFNSPHKKEMCKNESTIHCAPQDASKAQCQKSILLSWNTRRVRCFLFTSYCFSHHFISCGMFSASQMREYILCKDFSWRVNAILPETKIVNDVYYYCSHAVDSSFLNRLFLYAFYIISIHLVPSLDIVFVYVGRHNLFPSYLVTVNRVIYMWCCRAYGSRIEKMTKLDSWNEAGGFVWSWNMQWENKI